MTNTNAMNMSFRVDKDLKQQADILFKKLGMNTSVALNLFLTQCVRDQALPFRPDMSTSIPSKALQKALKEAAAIETGKIKVKGYHDVNAFIDDMLK